MICCSWNIIANSLTRSSLSRLAACWSPSLLFVLLRRWLRSSFLQLWLFSTLGFATHGLLDAATSYGTQLLWPFSDTRFSFSIISIIDPLFTLPILVFVILGIVRKSGRWGQLAMLWAACYLGAGTYQHYAAKSLAHRLAAERGHIPIRLEVKPTFANLVVWRSIYETENRFYVDAVRPSFGATSFSGASIAKLDLREAFPWLDMHSQQARDIERFAEFSDQFIAKAADDSERVIDVRYSFLPTEIAPLWSIRLDKNAASTAHVRFETHRANARENFRALLAIVLKQE